MRLGTLLSRINSLDLNSELSNILRNNEKLILDIQKSQLYDGKNIYGNDITPSYLDNPYFKSRASAERYAAWKMEITPNPKRNKYAPNLFINGSFHKSLKLEYQSIEAIKVYSSALLASRILSVHKNVLGLNKESIVKLKLVIDPIFKKNIRKKLL